jgi:hypothetical protein
MVSLPDGVVSVEIEDGAIFGIDVQGKKIMQFNIADDQWVGVERVYASWADPELLDEVRSAAEKDLGMSLVDYWATLSVDAGVSRNESIGSYRNNQTFLDTRQIELNFSGTSESDKAVIGYMTERGNEEVLFPYVFGYTFNGVFYQTSGVKGKDGQSVTFGSLDELESYFDANFKTGDVFTVNVQTFGVNDKTFDEWRSVAMDG